MFGSIQERSLSTLTSPGFLAALFLLLLNDFVLKPYLHNALTGKLSDFAGLFVFPLFWAAFLPRFRPWIYLGTGVIFVLWKSPASAVLIESWKGLGLFSIGRTVDYSDLWAMGILPVSYFYGTRVRRVIVARTVPAFLALVSMFAFAATSFSHKTTYNNAYTFGITKRELRVRMSRLSTEPVNNSFWEADNFSASIVSCLEAEFEVNERDQQSVLTLKETNFRCPTPPSKDEMRQTFERELINKLNEDPVTKSAMVRAITGWPNASPTPRPSVMKTTSEPQQNSSQSQP